MFAGCKVVFPPAATTITTTALAPTPPQCPSFTRGSDTSKIRTPPRRRCIKIITQTKNKNMITKKNEKKTTEFVISAQIGTRTVIELNFSYLAKSEILFIYTRV